VIDVSKRKKFERMGLFVIELRYAKSASVTIIPLNFLRSAKINGSLVRTTHIPLAECCR
jgi:hypothetical protein